MNLISFLFNSLMGCLLFISMFVAIVIALYLLKILLTELFDGYGTEEFIKWLKNIGQNVVKKKEKQ